MKSDQEQSILYHELGLSLIQLLGLKVKSNGRVNTQDGDKSPEGLGRTIERLYYEETTR